MLVRTMFLFLTDLNLYLYILSASVVEVTCSYMLVTIDELWLSRAVNAEISKLVRETCYYSLLLEYSFFDS